MRSHRSSKTTTTITTATTTMKRIILTGGGSAGHVTPNLALIPELRRGGWDIHYVGTRDGIEKELIAAAGVPYHPIAAGKLRRYANIKNLTDPFRVIQGLWQAIRIVRRLRPHIIFSKGGFVSVPVVVAGWMNRVPVVSHESDLTPGLANRLSLPFSTRTCVTFPETLAHLPKGKGVVTGSPVRRELLSGDRAKGLSFAGFAGTRPVLMVMGGSLGAASINRAVREALPELLQHYDIAHICGKGKVEPGLEQSGYRQFEYVGDELPDLMAATDLVLSRAGANFLFELLALRIPHLLVPLPKGASRGDQILNARSFERQGFSLVLPEEELNTASLMGGIRSLQAERDRFVEKMERSPLRDGVHEVMKVLRATARTLTV